MDVSIIIVSFNTKDILSRCLNSIFKYTNDLNFEVLVVDNNSADGSSELLKRFKIKYKNLFVIENKENLGFAKGNNLGIGKSKGKYILLLNSDTLLTENSILKMYEYMEKKPKCGIATCALLNSDMSEQATGGAFPTLSKIILWATFIDDLPIISKFVTSYHPHTNTFYLGSNYYEKEHQQDWVTGAFFMIRREVVNELPEIDPDFFMYVEELEYCYRAKKKGWQIWYTPITKIIHLGGASSPNKTNAIVGEFINLKLFYKKHFSGWQELVLLLLLKFAALLRVVVFGLLKQDKNSLVAYSRAFQK